MVDEVTSVARPQRFDTPPRLITYATEQRAPSQTHSDGKEPPTEAEEQTMTDATAVANAASGQPAAAASTTRTSLEHLLILTVS